MYSGPMEDVLCVPGIYIILTYSTQHTDRYRPVWKIYYVYLEYTSYVPTVLYTLLNGSLGILCVSGVYIILTQSTLHTDIYIDPRP